MTASNRVDRTVVVLGMHRSGTSLVAGILHALGVDMGSREHDEEWIGRHWSNPTGHFENREFVALDHRLLGGDPTGVRGHPDWESVPARSIELRSEIQALIARFEGPSWGWKDPWTVLTLEAFLPHLTRPKFVAVHRPKQEVVGSLRKRMNEGDAQLAGLFDLYAERLGALHKTLESYPWLDLEYSEVLARPAPTIQRIIDFLDLRPTREELDRALSMVLTGPALKRESQRMAVRGVLAFPRWVGWILKRDLRHNPRVVGSDLLGSVPKELYQTLRALL